MASTTFAVAVVSAYQSEQASFFSSYGKAWAIVSLSFLALSIVVGGFASRAAARLRMAANKDGLFVLEALGKYGSETDSKLGREVHDLLWSVALHLKTAILSQMGFEMKQFVSRSRRWVAKQT